MVRAAPLSVTGVRGDDPGRAARRPPGTRVGRGFLDRADDEDRARDHLAGTRERIFSGVRQADVRLESSASHPRHDEALLRQLDTSAFGALHGARKPRVGGRLGAVEEPVGDERLDSEPERSGDPELGVPLRHRLADITGLAHQAGVGGAELVFVGERLDVDTEPDDRCLDGLGDGRRPRSGPCSSSSASLVSISPSVSCTSA